MKEIRDAARDPAAAAAASTATPSAVKSTRSSSSSSRHLLSTFETLSISSHNGAFVSSGSSSASSASSSFTTPHAAVGVSASNPFFNLYPLPPHLTPRSSPSASFAHLAPLTPLLTPAPTPPAWPEQQHLGKLTVIVVEARGLNVERTEGEAAKPYVLCQYDRTDSVSLPFPSLPTPPLPSASSMDQVSPASSPEEREAEDEDERGTPSSPVWNHAASFDVSLLSRTILLCVYDKLAPQGGYPAHGFLGAAVFVPSLASEKGADGLGQDLWIPLESALDPTIGGEIRLRLLFEPTSAAAAAARPRLTIDDFQVLKQIGEGGFSRVYRVRKRDTKRIYAMKVIRKQAIASTTTLAHVLAERAILQRTIDSPFLVSLKFSFQSKVDLFFVMDYKSGGELFSLLQAEGGKFEESKARFYAAEILLGLSALHSADIIYRDLKPENCLLDGSGHLVLVDFGLSKVLSSSDSANTLCGTPEYLAPEVLMGEYNRCADWWSLGVLVFEMLVGYSPFYHESTLELYENILNGPIKIPSDGGYSLEAHSLMEQLLTRDPILRLGHLGSSTVQSHAFFSSISWPSLLLRQISPPFKPEVVADYTQDSLDHHLGLGLGRNGLGVEEWESCPSQRHSLSEEGVDELEIAKRREVLFKDFTFDAKWDLETKRADLSC